MSEDPDPIYSDGVQVGCAPFTVALTFTISPLPNKGPQTPKVVADVRMSPEHAKVMAMILRRQLKDFEQQLGKPVPVHPQVMQQLGLSPTEDW
ncbi:MAG: hypothetical protein K0Q72_5425 [Armatimonadetes bacterium]|jgi:hypothetical protein|nr:hypothetical protein [Armatimonadota bacterium]